MQASPSDINALAAFLANEQVQSLMSVDEQPVDAIVVCGSGILHCMDHVFSALSQNPRLTNILVLSGGKGHSTHHLVSAVSRRPEYASLVSAIDRHGEAWFMEQAFNAAVSEPKNGYQGPLLVDYVSTNCGANALETRKLLDAHGFQGNETVIIVQDPTMSLRSLACFEKAYEDLPEGRRPNFRTCPTFVPRMKESADGDLIFDVPGVPAEELWDTQRFLDLLLGEIPRLRDSESGYGPRGKGFITHVDIPAEIEAAWSRLSEAVSSERAGVGST